MSSTLCHYSEVVVQIRRAAHPSFYSRQAGVPGLRRYSVERSSTPRHISAVTRDFQTAPRVVSVLSVLFGHLHLTHKSLHLCGPSNNWHYLGHTKNYDDDDDDDEVMPCRNGNSGPFWLPWPWPLIRWPSYTNETRIPWRYTACAKVNFLVHSFESYRLTYKYRKTDRQDGNYIPIRFADGKLSSVMTTATWDVGLYVHSITPDVYKSSYFQSRPKESWFIEISPMWMIYTQQLISVMHIAVQ